MSKLSTLTQARGILDWLGNIVALLLTIAVNALANILPINGLTTGEVSALYPSLFTPAGYTFAIWSLIYLALTAFVIYQALPAQRHHARLADISKWFKLSCVANSVWIVLWHYELIPYTLLLMLVLLGSLAAVFRRLQASGRPAKQSEWLLLYAPFSLYFGWVTVATIANITTVETAYDLNDAGLSAEVWTVVKLALAALIATLVSTRYRDGIYAMVFVWAALGIANAQSETTVVFVAALALAAYCTVLAIRAFRAS